ncbi:MAG: GumC family protein, partial [Candidatus Binatia bacterium]
MNNIESSTSLRDFLNVIFKHKAKILTLFCATVITVAIGSFVMKPTYEATSQVLVKLGRENIYVPTSPTATSTSPIFSFSREEQINSEIEILKSRYLLEKVVESLGAETIYPDLEVDGESSLLKKAATLPFLRRLGGNQSGDEKPSPEDRALLRLRKKVSVEGVKKSDVIDITFQSHDPQVAAKVVNALVGFYLDHHLTVHKNPMAYDFFRDQAKLLEAKLKDSEGALEAFRRENTITSLQEQRSLVLRKAADLNAELKATLGRVQETKTMIRKLRQQLSRLSPNVELEKNIGGNPYVINTLKAKLAELELQEQEYLTRYTEKSRLVVNIREQIKTVKRKLAKEDESVYGSTRSGINTTYKALERELFSQEANLKALEARETSQRQNLAVYDTELERLNHIEAQFNHLERQVEINRQNYKLYLTKLEESRISNAMDMEKIANVSVIQPALTPIKPIKPRKLLNIILSILLGGIGGLGIA